MPCISRSSRMVSPSRPGKLMFTLLGRRGLRPLIQAGFRDVLEDAVNDIIAQLALVGHALIQMRRGGLQCLAHGSNAGHVLGACTVAGLLTAAIDQVLGPYALAAIQGTHALGAVELVGAHGQHIHAQFLQHPRGWHPQPAPRRCASTHRACERPRRSP